MNASLLNDFNEVEQFRLLPSKAVRDLLNFCNGDKDDVTYSLTKLEETVQTCHQTEDMEFYVHCLKDAIERFYLPTLQISRLLVQVWNNIFQSVLKMF